MAGDRPSQLDAEKKALSASEQDPARRAAWRDEVAALDPDDFVFVDETSPTVALTRRYAQAPRGHGLPTTLLAALSPAGLGAALTLVGAANTEAFTVYVCVRARASLPDAPAWPVCHPRHRELPLC